MKFLVPAFEPRVLEHAEHAVVEGDLARARLGDELADLLLEQLARLRADVELLLARA